MEISGIYILSQVFVLINYGLLMLSYQLNNRTKILVANFGALIANAIGFALLKGYSGVMMSLVAIVRNIIFLIDENKNGVREKNSLRDVIILIFLYIISLICAIFTYNGIWSLMVVCATMIYTYSVWQKNTKVYKILGIPVGITSLIYNIYVGSIFGIILESILTISALVGFLREEKMSGVINDSE